MKKRRLGKSDLYVSELGLGAMSIGTNKKNVTRIIDEALHLGINYIDTADLYDYGENERLIGEALKKRRPDVILATKGGNRFQQGESGWTWDPSRKHLLAAVKESLSRLQTDYIDLYQLHGGTIDDDMDEVIDTFESLKKEGLIRAYGLSSIRPNTISHYVKHANMATVMMQYSLLDRRPEEWFSFLAEHGVSVVARGSLAKGILSPRPLETVTAAKKGYLHYSPEELAQIRRGLDTLSTNGLTRSVLALQYCLAHPPVSSVVVGASTVDQLRQNVAAVSHTSINKVVYEELAKLTTPTLYDKHRP
ncbi:aldo/keto reductase [Bacillus sp. FSL W7-1360]